MNRRSRSLLASTLARALAAALLLVSCGGQQLAGGGTGGTGMSLGTVTGFGSVFVNGIEYETNGAAITVDGTAILESQHKNLLGLGMVVNVEAEHDGSRWVAKSIEYRSDIIGPAQTVDAVTLLVLGKRVSVTSDTHYMLPSNTEFTSIADLPAHAWVKVTGFPDSRGDITATRIEWDVATEPTDPAASPVNVEIRGQVAAVQPDAFTFTLKGTPGIQVRHDGRSAIAAGQWVRVTGQYDGSVIAAAKVEPEDRTFEKEGEFKIEGILAEKVDKTIFVNGYAIDASNGVADGVAENVRVQVEGNIEGGQLRATAVTVKRLSEMEVHAWVEDVDKTARTVTLLGRLFRITENTAIHHKREFFETVERGAWLEVHAYEVEPSVYVATEVEFEDFGYEIEGLVNASDVDVANGRVTISGITADLSDADRSDAIPGRCGLNDVACFLDYLADPARTVPAKVSITGLSAMNGVITGKRIEFDD